MLGIILLGAPGAGKGTQASYLTKRFTIPHIATGDILRGAIASGSELGKTLESILKTGALVSDELVISLVQERLLQPDCLNGYLFDGFPRTLKQAQSLSEAKVRITHVIEIDTPVALIVERLSGRWVHAPSGRTYHVLYNPPKTPYVDDVTHEPLVQRDDDQEETIKKRLQVYATQTMPVIEYYKNSNLKYLKVNGNLPANILNKTITDALITLNNC